MATPISMHRHDFVNLQLILRASLIDRLSNHFAKCYSNSCSGGIATLAEKAIMDVASNRGRCTAQAYAQRRFHDGGRILGDCAMGSFQSLDETCAAGMRAERAVNQSGNLSHRLRLQGTLADYNT